MFKKKSIRLLSLLLMIVVLGYLIQRRRPQPNNLSDDLLEAKQSEGSAYRMLGSGRELYLRRCAACHGEKSEGDREQMAGALASMPRWYLEEQLEKFRNGQRGAHPKDVAGQRMKAVADTLDLKEQNVLINYLVSVPPIAQQSTLEGDVELGRELFEVQCAMCHRYNGQGMRTFKSAPLNGQQDWYLWEQMQKFDQRIRGYHAEDEQGRKMQREMDATASEKDRLAILAYIMRLSEKYPINKAQQR